MLSDARIQVVLNHCHNRGSLTALCRIFVYRTGKHLVIRAEPVHVDSSVVVQLLGELFRQYSVELDREVSERIFQRERLLFVSENVLASRCMVHGRVIRFFLGQFCRDAFENLFLEISHILLSYVLVYFSKYLSLSRYSLRFDSCGLVSQF